jgi:glycosyltransferase involved in cell wall biosynthesis
MHSTDTDKFRILFFLSDYALGGSERQAVNLALHWHRTGVASVRFLCTKPGTEVPQLLEADGITCEVAPFLFQMPVLQRLSALRQTWKAMWAARPDIILCYGLQANVAAGLLWRLTPARCCVWQQRGIELNEDTPGRMERWSFALAYMVVANSSEGAAYIRQRFGKTAKQPLHIIYNGLTPAAPNPLNAIQATYAKQWAVVQLANLSHYKDFDTLLEGWRKFLDLLPVDATPRPILLLAGAGPQQNSIKAKAFDLGLSGHVRLVGKVKVADVLGWPRLFILSSKGEGQPNALLEPMLHGHLVLGSRVAGISEALGPDHAPQLTFADSDALAALLCDVYTRPQGYDSLKATLQQRAQTTFNMNTIAEQYERALGLVQ